MHAEELAVHYGCERKSVERLHAQVVESNVILVQACTIGLCELCRRRERQTRQVRTLFVEREVGSEMATFMIATNHPERFWEVDLKSVHVEEHLHREGALTFVVVALQKNLFKSGEKLTPVNIIAKEEILSRLRVPSHLKEFHQIVKLAVYIATNCRNEGCPWKIAR